MHLHYKELDGIYYIKCINFILDPPSPRFQIVSSQPSNTPTTPVAPPRPKPRKDKMSDSSYETVMRSPNTSVEGIDPRDLTSSDNIYEVPGLGISSGNIYEIPYLGGMKVSGGVSPIQAKSTLPPPVPARPGDHIGKDPTNIAEYESIPDIRRNINNPFQPATHSSAKNTSPADLHRPENPFQQDFRSSTQHFFQPGSHGTIPNPFSQVKSHNDVEGTIQRNTQNPFQPYPPKPDNELYSKPVLKNKTQSKSDNMQNQVQIPERIQPIEVQYQNQQPLNTMYQNQFVMDQQSLEVESKHPDRNQPIGTVQHPSPVTSRKKHGQSQDPTLHQKIVDMRITIGKLIGSDSSQVERLKAVQQTFTLPCALNSKYVLLDLQTLLNDNEVSFCTQYKFIYGLCRRYLISWKTHYKECSICLNVP